MNRRQQRSRALPLILALSLSGCAAMLYTTIDEHVKPPVDWPDLERRTHYVSQKEINEICRVGVNEACAVVNFLTMTCDKYFMVAEQREFVFEHEEKHCQGYDHPGERTFAEAWERFKQTRLARGEAR